MNLPAFQALGEILGSEIEVDLLLSEEQLPQKRAWECYYALAYECLCWGFLEDRARLLKKINWLEFNPLDSKQYPNIQPLVKILTEALINTKLKKSSGSKWMTDGLLRYSVN